MTEKIPLLWNLARSFGLMPARRLKSSFSMAFSRQRFWNSHSAQCRFSARSGGAAPASIAVISSTFRCAAVINAGVFTLAVEKSFPWTILPREIFRPSDLESASASNPSRSLSSLAGLLAKTNRTGMNRTGFPRLSDGMRSTA